MLSAVTAYARLFVGGLILALIAVICWQSSQIHRWHKQFDSEHSVRMIERASYVQAQKDAAAANHAEVKRIEQQSQRISDETQTAYQRDLAELRRLRSQSGAAKGSAGQSGAAKDGATAGGSDGASVPVPSSDDVQAASEIELRLMHLQNWVEGQLKAAN